MSISEVATFVALAAAGATALVTCPPLVLARRRAARLERACAQAQEQSGQLTAQAEADRAELHHLVGTRLPALVLHMGHQHVRVPGPLAVPSDDRTEREYQLLLGAVARAVVAERVRVDAAAQAVLRGTTTVMQAKSYQLQDAVAKLVNLYDDPRLAGALLGVDELNEQILRRIQATAVVCGATVGLTRGDSPLAELVTGASGRIPGYQRVQTQNQLALPQGVVAVVGRAAEPVAVVVAELLANAVTHSHGTLPVDVSLHQTDTGAVVIVDDDGVGLIPEEMEFAQQMISGQLPLKLADLGDPPRLGFAAIGRLVEGFDLRVSVDKRSPYGGVRAILYIPKHLLRVMPEADAVLSAATPPTVQHQVAADPGPAGTPEPGLVGAGGASVLPRRTRVSAQQPSGPPAHARPERTPEEASAPWGAFQRGSASGRQAAESSEGSTA